MKKLLALCLLLSCAGCQNYGPPASSKLRQLTLGMEPARTLEQLYNPNPRVRREAVLKLARRGDPSAVPILSLMLHTNQEESALVRASAAVALRMIGDPEAVYNLILTRHDPDPLVRRDIVKSLGALGGVEEIRTVGPMIVSDSDNGVRLEAAEALVRIALRAKKQGVTRPMRPRDAVPMLINGMDKNTDESVTFACNLGLEALTGQTLGESPRLWRQWWEKSKGKPLPKG